MREWLKDRLLAQLGGLNKYQPEMMRSYHDGATRVATGKLEKLGIGRVCQTYTGTRDLTLTLPAFPLKLPL